MTPVSGARREFTIASDGITLGGASPGHPLSDRRRLDPAGDAQVAQGRRNAPRAPHLARRFDVSEDDTLVLRMGYLEVVVRKPAWR